MDKNSYEIVLADLESEISVKKSEMERLQTEISQVESAISILRTKLENEEDSIKKESKEEDSIKQVTNKDIEVFFSELTESKFTRENQSKISLNNASEEILKKEGKPLYITDLIEKLEEYGRFTDRIQLSGTIRKDNKDRFINLGGNIWDLKSRHQQNNS